MDAQLVMSPKRMAFHAACLMPALMLPPLPCKAEGSWGASLGATSNYVYRGISQTSGGGAAQLGVNYQSALGWYAGAWGSNVDPYPGGESFQELDV